MIHSLMVGRKRFPAQFYRTLRGSEPVREWLRDLPAVSRRAIGFDVKEVEFGWPVGMPLCRSLGRGLWEIRSHLPDGQIARVIFCIHEDHLVLLHGFIKKTQQTPDHDMDLAMKRKREVEHG